MSFGEPTETTPGLGIINVNSFKELPSLLGTPRSRTLVATLIREMLNYHTSLDPDDRGEFTKIQEQLEPGSSRFNKLPNQNPGIPE